MRKCYGSLLVASKVSITTPRSGHIFFLSTTTTCASSPFYIMHRFYYIHFASSRFQQRQGPTLESTCQRGNVDRNARSNNTMGHFQFKVCFFFLSIKYAIPGSRDEIFFSLPCSLQINLLEEKNQNRFPTHRADELDFLFFFLWLLLLIYQFMPF